MIISCQKRDFSSQQANTEVKENISGNVLYEENIPEKETPYIFNDNSNMDQSAIKSTAKEEIDAIINQQQNESTGKYYFSSMESSETIETFLDDNNLQKYQKVFSDFENSFITITLASDNNLIIGASDELIGTILFWGEKNYLSNEIETGETFYGQTGDSLAQTLYMDYSINEKRDVVVFISIRNNDSGKTNEYKFIYKKEI
jgi:hypothetical protein